jgi:hypothetical protein
VALPSGTTGWGSVHLVHAYSRGGFAGQPSCSVMCHRLHQASKQVSDCYKEDVDLLLLNRATRNGSSSKTSPRKYRMMQGRHA